MTQATLRAVLASLEEEIRLLRQSLKKHPVSSRGNNGKDFSSLKGLWKGKVSFSFQDIKASEMSIKSF